MQPPLKKQQKMPAEGDFAPSVGNLLKKKERKTAGIPNHVVDKTG